MIAVRSSSVSTRGAIWKETPEPRQHHTEPGVRGRIMMHWQSIGETGRPVLQKFYFIMTWKYDRWKNTELDYNNMLNIGMTSTLSCWKVRLACRPSQCETTLQCNIVSHWLGAYTKCLLHDNFVSSVQQVYFISPLHHIEEIFIGPSVWSVKPMGLMEKRQTDPCYHNKMTVYPAKFKTAWWNSINTLRPRQNGCHFADDTLKCIFLNENVWILIEISLKFVPKGRIDNIPALV